MSLDGSEETTSSLQMQVDHIAKNMTTFEVHQSLYGKVEELEEGWADPEDLRTKARTTFSGANNEFTQPVTVVEGPAADNAATNKQLARQRIDLENRLDPLEEQVDQNQQNIITLQEELEQLTKII